MCYPDDAGAIMFTACHKLLSCKVAPDAEISSLMGSLVLAREWTYLPIVVESDCWEATNLVKNRDRDRNLLS